jgi:drug/metabolite transporter (DMT)-like permease
MIKVGLDGAPPITSAGIRFIIASLMIFSILVARRIRLPRDTRFYRLSFFLGLFQMGIPYGLVYWAELHISSGLTSILFSTMPFTVAILARLFLGDPITLPKMTGIAIGTAGVAVIFWDGISLGGPHAVYGIAAALGSAILASVSTIVVKKHSRSYNPIASIFLPMLIGGAVLMIGSILLERGEPVTWNAMTITSILYLAAFGSVAAFGLYYWIIKHMDVTVLSYQTFIIPILACFIGWIFLRETITIKIALGGGLILAGIALATFPRFRKKEKAGA